MKELFTKILGSLDNSDNGAFSARKLSALVVIIMVVILHVKWFRSSQWQYLAEVLFLDYSFILVCLGLATWQQITNKKIENEGNKEG